MEALAVAGLIMGREDGAPRPLRASSRPWRSSSGQYARELAVVFAAYLLGGKIGLMVPFTSGNVSPVWPAAGVAMAALLLVGYRVWPSIAAAALLVNFFTAIPALAALGMAAGNTAGPLVGVWLMRRISSFNGSLARLTDVGTILVAAPLAAAVSASIGVAVLFATGVNPWLTFVDAWRVWWLGDSMGMLIVTPVALTFPGRKLHSVREAAELGTLLVAVTVTSFVLFKPGVNIQSGIVLAAAVMPFVLWGAVRFETRGAALVVLLVSCVVVWQTHLGAGPFARSTASHAAALLQAFLAMIGVSGLTLAAAIAEKSHLIRERAHREGVAESERKYRRIVETANDGIWMLDGHLATIFANQRLAELLGYTVAEMDRRSLFDFLFEEDSRQKAAELQRCRQSASEHLERRFRRKDGTELWALVSRTSTFDEAGRLIGVLKMICDVTEQRRAERDSQLARETVLLLSEAVNQTADSVVVTDSSGRIEYVNRAFETTTGYTREEALGKTPRLLKSGHHDAAFYRHMWDVLLRGQTFRGTLVNSRKNGERYWAEQTITPIKDVQGTTTHFMSVLKDVTVARQNQEHQIRLRLAREVQQRFYTATVQVPGFDIAAAAYPAEQTGGDYFDCIHAAAGPCYVSIGDVSGHGLDAAIVMAMTRAYVRSFATLGLDVAEILARVNEVLVEDLTEDRFVTLLLVRLEPGSRKLEYANAGHVPGFVLNRTGDTEAVLDSTGVPLGLFSGSVFSTRTLWLDGGQIMVLCTDGATETSKGGEEEFGCERLLDDVRAHRHGDAREIAESIYRAVRTFAAGEPQHDDITSVIVKVQ